MTRVLSIAFGLVLLAMPSAAAEIREYTLRAQIDESGTARAVLVVVGVPAAGELVVPVPWGDVQALRLTEAPAGTAVRAERSNGHTRVVFIGQESPNAVRIVAEFTMAEVLPVAAGGGRRPLRHTLQHLDPAPIGVYVAEVVFPSGWRGHAVRAGGPRLRLTTVAGAAGARFEATNVRQGETVTWQVELARRQRSWLWWLVGVSLSLAYLVRFRDMVSGAKP